MKQAAQTDRTARRTKQCEQRARAPGTRRPRTITIDEQGCIAWAPTARGTKQSRNRHEAVAQENGQTDRREGTNESLKWAAGSIGCP
jgi:hypothetical protein